MFIDTPKYPYDPHPYQKIMTLKKHTYKPKKISIICFHTKKIITLKKDTYKPENAYITLFYSHNFLKVTILKKSIHTNYKHSHNTFRIKNNQIKKHTNKS